MPDILVADDDRSMRTVILDCLETEGFSALGVADGVAALEAFKKRKFDLLITDLKMPKMDGQKLFDEVRKLAPDFPIIVITGYSKQSQIVEFFEDGICGYLQKPFSYKELIQLAKTVLRRREELVGGDFNLNVPVKGWIELTASSITEYIDRFESFCSLLTTAEIDDMTKKEIRLTLEELANNAIEWGNKANIQKKFLITYCLFPDEFVLKIEDQGEGFEPEVVPDPTADPWAHINERKKQGKRIGGYGIHLVKNVMDTVVYSAAGNTVIASKKIKSRKK